jgi:CheY-like chemotaxis protein
MPGLDGYETIRRVRALPPIRCRTLPAIVLTYPSGDDRTRARQAGYTLHVAKSFAPDELVSACAQAITADSWRGQ